MTINVRGKCRRHRQNLRAGKALANFASPLPMSGKLIHAKSIEKRMPVRSVGSPPQTQAASLRTSISGSLR
jgi:hypothetical protein